MTAAADAATARAPTSGAGILQMPDRTASPSLSAGAAAADPSSSRALTARRPDRLTKQQSQQQQQQQADPLSDRATALLIRRTLCPQLQQQQQVGGANDNGRDGQQQAPIEEILQLLPPLTSRNDVDLQLYAFLAIVLREFVQSWYTRITSDEAFVAEVVHIIAHCTRALEQRCRKLDLESLLLDEIPDLLNRHITAYRVAQEPVSQPPVEAHAREIYHALCPLPYLSPVPRSDDPDSVANQLDNERAYREMLVEAVLTILLPTEDLENPCLTAIVGQIFSELIIGNIVANKAAQPWLLLEAIGIGCRAAAGKKNDKSSSSNDDNGSSSSSSEKRSSQATGLDLDASQRQRWKESTVQGFFVSIIRFGVLAWGAIRFLVTTLVMSSSLPPRDAWLVEKGGLRDSFHSSFSSSSPSASTSAKVPVVTFRVWSCVGNLIQLPTRMPWLSGFLSLVQYGAALGPGRIAGLNSRIDRLLSHHIQSALSPSQLPPLLRTLRGVLFPNNAPGTSQLSPPSSDAELCALRRRTAITLWGLLPKSVGRVYFGGHLWPQKRGSDGVGSAEEGKTVDGKDTVDDNDKDDEATVDQLEDLLMILSDEYCNKHLMYGILELLLVRLMPELSTKGVVELLDERLG